MKKIYDIKFMTKALQRTRLSLIYTFFFKTCSLKKKRYTLTLSNCVNLTTEYIALAPKKKKKKTYSSDT